MDMSIIESYRRQEDQKFKVNFGYIMLPDKFRASLSYMKPSLKKTFFNWDNVVGGEIINVHF